MKPNPKIPPQPVAATGEKDEKPKANKPGVLKLSHVPKVKITGPGAKVGGVVALLLAMMLSVFAQPGIITQPGTQASVFTNRLLTTLQASGVTNRLTFTNASAAFGATNATHIKSNSTAGRWEWLTNYTSVVATNVNNRSTGVWTRVLVGAATYGQTRYEPRSPQTLPDAPSSTAANPVFVQVNSNGVVTSPTNFWEANADSIESSGVDAPTVAAIMDTNNAATAASATNLYGTATISALTASAPLSFDILGGTITSGNATFGASGFNLTGGGINPTANHSTNFVGNAANLTNIPSASLTGTINEARLPATIPRAVASGGNTLVQTNGGVMVVNALVEDSLDESQIGYIRGVAKQVIARNQFSFSTGDTGHNPGTAYGQMWLRDWTLARDGVLDAISLEESTSVLNTWSNQFYASRAFPDFLDSTKTSLFDGYSTAGGKILPSLDVPFDFMHAIYQDYLQRGNAVAFSNNWIVASNAMNFLGWSNNAYVPLPGVAIRDGLVYSTNLLCINAVSVGITNYGSFGFHDAVPKRGYDLWLSLVRYRALKEAAELSALTGQRITASNLQWQADQVPAALVTYLWSATNGYFLSATETNTIADPLGSAYAVWLGAVDATRAYTIASNAAACSPGGALWPSRAVLTNGAVLIPGFGNYWQWAPFAGAGSGQNGTAWQGFAGIWNYAVRLYSPAQAAANWREFVDFTRSSTNHQFLEFFGPAGAQVWGSWSYMQGAQALQYFNRLSPRAKSDFTTTSSELWRNDIEEINTTTLTVLTNLTTSTATNTVRALSSGSPTALSFGALANSTERSKAYQTSRLIEGLKAAGLWVDLLHLRVDGKGYQNTSNSLVLRGPRFDFGGTKLNFGLNRTNETAVAFVLERSVSDFTMLVAGAGCLYYSGGVEKELMSIRTADTYPWARLYMNGGNTLTAQTTTGGNTFLGAGGAPAASSPPQTYVLTHTSSDKGLVVYTNAAQAVSNYNSSSALSGIQTAKIGEMPFNYAVTAIWGRALTTNEVTTLDGILRTTVLGANCNIIVDGDSILFGSVTQSNTWDNYLMGGGGSDWSVTGKPYDITTGGHTTAEVMTNMVAAVRQYTTNSLERKIYVLHAGINDLSNIPAATRSLDAIKTNLLTIWNSAKTNGCCPVVATTLFASDITVGSGGRPQSELIDLNAWIRLQTNYWDVLVDFDALALSRYGPNYMTNTVISADGVHMNGATGGGLRFMRDAFDSVAWKVFP